MAVDDYPFERSAMSNLWRVRDKAAPDGRPTHALKEMRYEKGRSSTAYRRFVREIETLAQKLKGSHSGIVEVVDHSIPSEGDESDPYYVMPLARSSLQRAKNLKGKLESVLEIALNVADALAAAHLAGIVHRDVKPGNVLLFGDELRPSVCDFGICYLEEEDRLTRAEANTIGTRDFVAPELQGGGLSQSVTAAADVYSLGKTIFAVVAGGDVFPREWIKDPRFDLASSLNDPRLRHLVGMMELMVTEKPEDRLQTMTEVRDLIQRVLDNLRRGTEYTDGLYRRASTPVERLRKTRTELDSPPSTRRSDALRQSIDESVESAKARAIAFEVDQKQSLRLVVGAPHVGALEVAEECAEELLAVGLPLVQADEQDLFDEWLGLVVEPTHRTDGYQHLVSRLVLGPVGVLAAHAAAALALKTRRFQLLRSVIDRFVADGSRWIHHDILGREASRLDPWLAASIAKSNVVKAIDPALAGDATKWVRLVSGLAAVRLVRAITKEQLDALAADIYGNSFPTEFAPGFIDVRWLADLLDLVVARPPVERELARVVFDMTPEEFRTMFREITPALVLVHRSVMGRLQRIPYTALGLDPKRWKDWCGYDKPLVVF